MKKLAHQLMLHKVNTLEKEVTTVIQTQKNKRVIILDIHSLVENIDWIQNNWKRGNCLYVIPFDGKYLL